MDIGSIFLLLGILLLVSLYISQPLMKKQATIVSDEERVFSSLLADRDRILKTLQDLDFDYSLGKIPEERYPVERAELLQLGAAILMKLDEYQLAGRSADFNSPFQVALEKETTQTLPTKPIRLSDDELETMIANRLRDREGRSRGFCPQCGHAVQLSDLFCPRCGHSIRSES
jgi:hypothetical protein